MEIKFLSEEEFEDIILKSMTPVNYKELCKYYEMEKDVGIESYISYVDYCDKKNIYPLIQDMYWLFTDKNEWNDELIDNCSIANKIAIEYEDEYMFSLNSEFPVYGMEMIEIESVSLSLGTDNYN